MSTNLNAPETVSTESTAPNPASAPETSAQPNVEGTAPQESKPSRRDSVEVLRKQRHAEKLAAQEAKARQAAEAKLAEVEALLQVNDRDGLEKLLSKMGKDYNQLSRLFIGLDAADPTPPRLEDEVAALKAEREAEKKREAEARAEAEKRELAERMRVGQQRDYEEVRTLINELPADQYPILRREEGYNYVLGEIYQFLRQPEMAKEYETIPENEKPEVHRQLAYHFATKVEEQYTNYFADLAEKIKDNPIIKQKLGIIENKDNNISDNHTSTLDEKQRSILDSLPGFVKKPSKIINNDVSVSPQPVIKSADGRSSDNGVKEFSHNTNTDIVSLALKKHGYLK